MKADIKTVMEAGRKADQLEAVYGLCRRDVGIKVNTSSQNYFKGRFNSAHVQPNINAKFESSNCSVNSSNMQGQILRPSSKLSTIVEHNV